MIKKALEYIVGLSEAKVSDIKLPDGTVQTYSDKPLNRLIKHIPMAENIEMHTLTSLVDYLKTKVDTMQDKMIIEVAGPRQVKLYSPLNEERDREYLVIVNARTVDFPFNKFISSEEFVINVQSKFIETEDKNLVLKFAGTVEAGTIAEYGDDGVSQKATIKTSITNRTEGLVPNPVKLKPYRTFLEVEQPLSEFVFRMKQDRCDGIQCALFEADGGAWKIDAVNNIKNYLQKELAELPEFIVIA